MSLFEFLIYTILAILWYRNIYTKVVNTKTRNNNEIFNSLIEYNISYYNTLSHLKKCRHLAILSIQPCETNKSNDNEVSIYGLKHGCGIIKFVSEYDVIWLNNTENGLGIKTTLLACYC